ncbi:MAG: 50S ribosomal protein L11 methyltransferase [Oscillospiraceae bacterium]|nr:50S ribosomal protein L11 methyltransferase [Oscillospiraceae bacterium]
MAWLEITVQTAPGNVDQTAAALTAAGFSELVIEDQQEFKDFLEQNRACWDYIDEKLQQQLTGLSRIRLYLEDTDTQALEKLASLVERRGLTMCQNLLAEENWEESWKDNYPPVELGKSLVILPYWLEDTYAGDRIPVILDPGLTFGTGSHPSTQMVIEAMEETVKAGDNCLDLGSGSGILSITALRLGAKQAVGVDIDPKAEDMARENAAANGYGSEKFTALTGDVTADSALMARLAGKYDLVFVNIVADVIIHLAPVLPKFLSADSTLICSGILDSRLEDVKEALNRAGIDPIRVCAREDWRCIIAKRRLQ